MAGHSKWAQIKHKKAKVDAARGKLFAKLIREIQVAARLGGPDPDLNPRLRLAIERAKAHNMPSDNIERAIKRATGGEEGANYEEVLYEGYGPGGAALFIEVLTDNRNRTFGEIRSVFNKYGGSLGKAGSVAWQFEDKGIIYIEAQGVDEEALYEVALEAGATDINLVGDTYEITCEPGDFAKVKSALEEGGFKISQAQLTKVPKSTVKVEGKDAEKLLRLIEALEELDDVQHVYSNFDIPEEVLESLS